MNTIPVFSLSLFPFPVCIASKSDQFLFFFLVLTARRKTKAEFGGSALISHCCRCLLFLFYAQGIARMILVKKEGVLLGQLTITLPSFLPTTVVPRKLIVMKTNCYSSIFPACHHKSC
jgi:hypothetical protein